MNALSHRLIWLSAMEGRYLTKIATPTHLVTYRQILHILSLSKQYLHYLLVRFCVNIKICNSFTVSTDQANLGPASLLMMVD